MQHSNRRTFLQGTVCAACVLVTGCGGNAPGPVDAGRIEDYASGVLKYVGSGVAVGKDEGGLYAVSTLCTHAQCDMGEDGDLTQVLLTCNCHGSQFGIDGGVITGPAQDPLDFYEITLGDFGEVTVHTDRSADPDTRVSTDEV
jgi:Rieske Fe-S protein